MKIILLLLALSPITLLAQKPDTKAQKKADRKAQVQKLKQQAEEDAIVFNKQTAFGIKLATDGYGAMIEIGKMKTLNKASLYWFEIGERKHPKEEKLSLAGFNFSNPFIYGKRNNFYFAKFGIAQNQLIGGKGNKNGVAVSAVYGGGISAGLLKPYYIEILDPGNGKQRDIRYSDNLSKDDTLFMDPSVIIGGAGFTKGFGEMKFVPGAHAKAALRFDYGRYNEMVSALEVGLNAEFYSQKMPIMLLNKEKNLFINAYVSIVFGKRK